MLEAMPIGVTAFLDPAVSKNHAERARKTGVALQKLGNGGT